MPMQLTFPLLSTLIFLPLVGILVLLLVPGRRTSLMRWAALLTTLAVLAVSLVVLASFDPENPSLQLVERHLWFAAAGFRVEYFVGVDGLSILLVLLTTLLMGLAILSTWTAVHERVREFMIFFLLLEIGMVGVFLAMDLFLFYVFWEFTLVPMYFLIGMWGGERRMYAAVKFFLYTMAGSVLMLLAILWLGLQGGSFNLPELIAAGDIPATTQFWLFLAFAAAFAIKVPMWPLHSWLPDAHVEAPTAGSVILAGVLLKMGTYGFLASTSRSSPRRRCSWRRGLRCWASSASCTAPPSPIRSATSRSWWLTRPSAIWVSSCSGCSPSTPRGSRAGCCRWSITA